jgi:ubiquinone/menaquinone biosynthesis C-methylase UbiE
MSKLSDAPKGLSGSDLEQVRLEGGSLEAYRDFWDRSAEVDSIRAIADGQDQKTFEVSGRGDAEKIAALLPPGGSALEIGCGTGRVLQHLAAWCESLHGIDISKGMVEQGRKRLAHLPNVTLVLGNGYDLEPFADESFDLVYSLLAFQHMPKTTAYNYLVESARVLRPGGVLRFQVPNILREDHFLAFHHFTQPWFVEHPYPMNYYTPSEIVSMVSRAGLRVEDLSDEIDLVTRKTDDPAPDVSIRKRIVSFEHPWAATELAELAELSRRLDEATAELEAMRRRKAVRVANAVRHPISRIRAGR